MKNILLAGLLLLTVSVVAGFGQNTTVIVTGNTTTTENTPGGWWFNRDASTATPYGFTNTQASTGYGSLYVPPIGPNANDKFIGENYVRSNIADVNSISFDFLMGSGATNPNQFYVNVYAVFGSSLPTKYYDCRYDFVASAGSTSTWTTLSFTPTTVPTVVATRGSSPFPCPATLSGMDSLSSGSQIRAIAVTLGDTSTNDVGYDGYFDHVVVDRVSGKTTYDFEPYLVASSKDQCKGSGWMNYRRADGSAFKNQGDCVSYTVNGK
jgi:hypothetical protein